MGIFNTRPRFQDRDMKQLSGDTITLSGDTNIDGVFRYKPGAVTGYVLTSVDGDGTVMWSPSSGGTGTFGTSGVDGTSGTSGVDGTSGTSGIDGNDGTSGTSGIDGNDGTSGTSGISGGGNNIYNSDGVLTDDRIVDIGDNQSITFTGTNLGSKFEVITEFGTANSGLIISPRGNELYYLDNLSSDVNAVEVDSEGIVINAVDGGVADTKIQIEKGIITTGSDMSTFKGIEYAADYSNAYSNRSLVDKEYVNALLNSYGQICTTTGGTINIVTAGAYQSTFLTGTLDSEINGMEASGTFGLKNTSGKEQLFKIYASADIEAGNNKRLGIKLALNGVPIDETECNAPTGNGTSFAKLVTNWMVRLQNGDEITLLVTNFTNTGNVTLERARIVANTII